MQRQTNLDITADVTFKVMQIADHFTITLPYWGIDPYAHCVGSRRLGLDPEFQHGFTEIGDRSLGARIVKILITDSIKIELETRIMK